MGDPVYCIISAFNVCHPFSDPMLLCPEEGDDLRMEVPKEAKAEIKKASGTVFNMGESPFWWV